MAKHRRRLSEDELLDREFAFSVQPHADFSCKDLFDPFTWCRREKGHLGAHAAGYGDRRVRWSDHNVVL
jgi:hypothetical protein